MKIEDLTERVVNLLEGITRLMEGIANLLEGIIFLTFLVVAIVVGCAVYEQMGWVGGLVAALAILMVGALISTVSDVINRFLKP